MIDKSQTSIALNEESVSARHASILMAHGGGGQLTDDLIRSAILPRLGNSALNELLDSAILPAQTNAGRPALTIDSYVVEPWRFPGGDIGRLAVCGTVNDLAVCGAKPLGLALSCILTEGFAQSDFEAILDSIRNAAQEANVHVVTGDTKVVGRGHADGVYLTTAGVGWVDHSTELSPRLVRPDDVLLINGPIGDHGLAVMLARELPEVRSSILSDVAPLNGMLQELRNALGNDLVFMRDVTRGGLAGVAADLAQLTGHRVILNESAIPVRPETRHAADMLGLDPLEIANEGKALVVVRPEAARDALDVLAAHALGEMAAIIGRVEANPVARCELETRIGGRRIIPKPYGEQLPRIC
jgi:hydrogenase expression/formation protein HypE